MSLRVYPSSKFFLGPCMLTDLPVLRAPPLAPCGKKPIVGSLNLPHPGLSQTTARRGRAWCIRCVCSHTPEGRGSLINR